jgi:hypothetical protein
MRQPSPTSLLERPPAAGPHVQVDLASGWTGAWRTGSAAGELRPLRRATAALAVAALLMTLLVVRILPDGQTSPHALVARPLNLTIAWLDLRLGLGHEASGAQRAVTSDPGLTTSVGRLGARWLAERGTPAERLTWAGRLAGRDEADRPLLQAAVIHAWCSGRPELRREATAVARRAGLQLPRRPAC